MNAPRHYAVIGAGWAGCAAAVALAAGGHRVSLFEAARTLGGRARRVELDERTLDNGQHILLGAYRSTLALMKQIGVDPACALLRLPLQMRYPLATGAEGMDFVAPRLPAPWHVAVALLRAKGLQREDKMALARFSTTARWMGWQLRCSSRTTTCRQTSASVPTRCASGAAGHSRGTRDEARRGGGGGGGGGDLRTPHLA